MFFLILPTSLSELLLRILTLNLTHSHLSLTEILAEVLHQILTAKLIVSILTQDLHSYSSLTLLLKSYPILTQVLPILTFLLLKSYLLKL